MDNNFRTDDFPTIMLKRSTMKFFKAIPDDDWEFVTPKNVFHAEILKEHGFIFLGTLDHGEHCGKQICYKLKRGESYLAFRHGIEIEKRLSNIQSWIAIGISLISIVISIMK